MISGIHVYTQRTAAQFVTVRQTRGHIYTGVAPPSIRTTYQGQRCSRSSTAGAPARGFNRTGAGAGADKKQEREQEASRWKHDAEGRWPPGVNICPG